MEKLNTRELQRRGAALASGFRRETGKLVLLYCGVIAALSLGSSGLQLFLESRIGQTGGLGGLGMRSVLQTVQTILDFVNMFFGPFWSAGFLLAVLGMVRGGAPRLEDLTGGFRRFGRILGGLAFEYMTVVAVTTGGVYLAGILFALTPMGRELGEIMMPLMSNPNFITPEGMVNLEMIPMQILTRAALPVAGLLLLTLVPAFVWIGYGFRMAMYLMMERPIGGFRAHMESMRLMRGYKWQLFKLDLRFWWYHGLGVLLTGVGSLDLILEAVGVPVPVDSRVMFFGTLVLYLVLQTALFLWKKCDVDAAYVLAFEQIAYPEVETE
jgi:uncharacterized membrane protein